ncbi:DUF805 domain-containing protein [Pseudosulfitobacter pseudonitzschiae]|nr:DUF805 domain-containing protein [Pseudosulfitobacter pseudonitzschiae]
MAGIFASWLAEKISLRPFASAAVDQGGEPADTNNQPQLAAQMAWGLIWFGGVGAVSAWSLIFVFGSSSALVLLTRVTYVAGLAGLACFAVLKVLRAAEKQEPWVATAQSGAGAVRLGLMGWLRYAFSFSGSVSRPRFLVSQLAAGIIQIVSILWLLESPASLFPWLMILAAGVSMLAFGARRTRDTGVSQWWFLLVLVPALNLAVLAFLFLVPTDEFRGRGL